jgi:hypothetical protein
MKEYTQFNPKCLYFIDPASLTIGLKQKSADTTLTVTALPHSLYQLIPYLPDYNMKFLYIFILYSKMGIEPQESTL